MNILAVFGQHYYFKKSGAPGKDHDKLSQLLEVNGTAGALVITHVHVHGVNNDNKIRAEEEKDRAHAKHDDVYLLDSVFEVVLALNQSVVFHDYL